MSRSLECFSLLFPINLLYYTKRKFHTIVSFYYETTGISNTNETYVTVDTVRCTDRTAAVLVCEFLQLTDIFSKKPPKKLSRSSFCFKVSLVLEAVLNIVVARLTDTNCLMGIWGSVIFDEIWKHLLNL